MYLRRLSILNYKNIAECELGFSAKINCFVGANGSGKTNLLDAVYYLCMCKSKTTPSDRDVIRHDADLMMLQGDFVRSGIEENVSAGVKRGAPKRFKLNGKDYKRLAEHIGFLPAVMISPDDGELIAEGSEMRRKFVDSVISQCDRPYLEDLMRYNRLLLQRNALLKEEQSDPALYETIELQMAALAGPIFERRKAFVESFTPIFGRYYEQISLGREQPGLHYKSHLENGDLSLQLAACRPRDLAAGYTTRGIHKDEIEMSLGGYPVKREGSQGQGKTFLAALKLAQFDFMHSAGGVRPVLLLDDIFDKLDSARVGQLIKLAGGSGFGQIFITDTNRQHIDALLENSGAEYKLFGVAGGVISEAEQ